MHYLESAHETIDSALQAVANASIGDELEVRPLPADGTFYDYDLGVVDFNGEQLHDDYRAAIFEPCEFIDSALQVRHYLPEAVQALEAGKAVSFGYAAMEPLTHDDCDCIAGWTLMARI